MTSINAIKFDFYRGACVCDEARGWDNIGSQIFVVEKMKQIVPERIRRDTGLVALYGNTGTSTIGDELRLKIEQRLGGMYDKALKEKGAESFEHFLTIEELARVMWDCFKVEKHTHIDEELRGKFGFDTADFVRGFYMSGDEKIEIKDPAVIEEVEEFVTWKSMGDISISVFLNSGIIAGFEPRKGFRIFHLSQIWQYAEPVTGFFQADGTGLDCVNQVLGNYGAGMTLPERRGDIDAVEGLIAIIAAVNAGSRHNIGVGGYFGIYYIDGSRPDNMDMISEFMDDRSKLASEIVEAYNFGLISRSAVRELINDLIVEDTGFDACDKELRLKTKNAARLSRLLRGWKVWQGRP